MTVDIKLPPLPDLPAYSSEVFDREVKVVSETMAEQLMQDYARAAIEAYRQQRGGPVARVNAEGFIVEIGLDLAPGTNLYVDPQPAEPIKQNLPPLHLLSIPELRELAMRDCSKYDDDDLAIAWELFDRLVEGDRIVEPDPPPAPAQEPIDDRWQTLALWLDRRRINPTVQISGAVAGDISDLLARYGSKS